MKRLILCAAAAAALAGAGGAWAQPAECATGIDWSGRPNPCAPGAVQQRSYTPSGHPDGRDWGPYAVAPNNWVHPYGWAIAQNHWSWGYDPRVIQRHRDLDRDGVRNSRDRDRDGDGVLNWHDRYPSDPRYR